jgi:glucokinase
MILGVDVGGTWIKTACVAADGRLDDRERFATPQLGPDSVVSALADCLRRHSACRAMGVGVPGVVDSSGTVYNPPNMAGWTTVPLRAMLERACGVPVAVDNDANAAALAESRGDDAPTTYLYVTLGTGVGGAIVVERSIFRGITGGAGEFGHVVVRADDSATSTGHTWRSGTVEEYVGARALEAAFGGTIADLVHAYNVGNHFAQTVIMQAVHVLAAGLAGVCAVTGIPTIIVGGGITDALPAILPLLEQALRHRSIPSIATQLSVRPARWGNDAGIVGAAALLGEGRV